MVKVGPSGSQKDVEVIIWLPGIIGHLFIGMLSGILVFCIFSAPSVVAANVSVQEDASTKLVLTLYMIGTALLAGLSGTSAINQLVEKRQWAELNSVAGQTKDGTALAPTGRPASGLNLLAQRE